MTKLSGTKHVLIPLILLISILPDAFAADEKPHSGGPEVHLQTVYLAEPVGRAHQIRINVQLGGTGTLTLDPNTCTVSMFGDRAVCTEIAPQPIAVRATQLRFADPTGRGRRIFSLTSDEQSLSDVFYLVIPRRRSEPHRLIVDSGSDRRRVFTVEAIPTPTLGKSELCANASYSASQSGGKVTLTATGEHPTAGWKTEFEQLPIRIYPPQYRLVCVRPAGVVAQVLRPFEATASFKAERPVSEIIIHDSRGRHSVAVRQLDEKN